MMQSFLLVLVLGLTAVSPCTEQEHREMQNQFSACRTNYSNQFHDSDGGDQSLCILLDQIINVCAQKWNQCHELREIENMKGMHTEAFIEHWGSTTNIEQCQTVKNFRSALYAVAVPNENILACDDEESSAAMNKFQTCSHSTSSTIYTSVLDLDDTNTIIESLCAGLHNISSECPGLLATCFAPDDVKQMKTLHLQEMKKFYYTLVEDKIPKNALESCDEGPIGPNEGQTVDSIGATDVHHPVHIQIVNTDLQELNNDDLSINTNETNDIHKFEKDLDDEGWSVELHEEHDDALDTDDHHNSDGGRLDDWRIDEGLDTIQRILRTDDDQNEPPEQTSPPGEPGESIETNSAAAVQINSIYTSLIIIIFNTVILLY